MDSSPLRERLRDLRKARGLTQIQLATKVGTTQTSIARLESGETASPRAIGPIAQALGTTVEYLQGLTDEPSPTNPGAPLVLLTPPGTPTNDVTVEYDTTTATGRSISTYGAQTWYESMEKTARTMKPDLPEWAWRDVRDTHPARSSKVPIIPRTLADLAQFYWENFPAPPDADELQAKVTRK